MHRRNQIRNEAVSVATGLPTTGARVFNNQLFPLEQTQLPAWIVAAGDEAIEVVGMGGQYERRLELPMIATARATSGEALQNTLDTMLEELESVMLRDAFTDLIELDLTEIEIETSVDDNDQASGEMTCTFVAVYETLKGAAGA